MTDLILEKLKKDAWENVVLRYKKFKKEYPENRHHYLDEFLDDALLYYDEISSYQGKDKGQAGRSINGKHFEYFVYSEIEDSLKNTDLIVIGEKNFSKEKKDKSINRQISIKFGDWGDAFPDSDILICNNERKVLAIISCKTKLRERFTQSLYWNLKLKNQEKTKDIKLFTCTQDIEALTGRSGETITKNRKVSEIDVDCTFLVCQNNLYNHPDKPESKVKDFNEIFSYLLNLKSLN